jgi:RHS repeat-associated protein
VTNHHPDYLTYNEYITDKSGRLYQYFHYSAFGEVLVQRDANYGSFQTSYTFNAKEFDAETGFGYYGARYYNPTFSVWLGVDPLAGEYVSTSPYLYVENNPIMFIDPNGLWKSRVNDNGSISYLPERGDNAGTLAKQYGISMDAAIAILGGSSSKKLTGMDVNRVLGTRLLHLDLESSLATQQRIFEHFLFARDHSRTEGATAFVPARYFKNPGFANPLTGIAHFDYNGKRVKVHYRIPWKRLSFDRNGGDYWAMANTGIITPVSGDYTKYFLVSDKLEIDLMHPKTGNYFGDKTTFTVDRENSKYLEQRFNRELPEYNPYSRPELKEEIIK